MQEQQQKIIRRLKIMKGQMEGIIKMIESSNPDCVQVLTQIKAVKSAFTPIEEEITKSSLKRCVSDSGTINEEKFDSILKMFGKSK